MARVPPQWHAKSVCLLPQISCRHEAFGRVHDVSGRAVLALRRGGSLQVKTIMRVVTGGYEVEDGGCSSVLAGLQTHTRFVMYPIDAA